MFDEDYDDRPSRWHLSKRKLGKILAVGSTEAGHIPNKAERRLLTQMMQKSGQTEEQVRASKSNRQKLAAAAKSMSAPIPGKRRAYELKQEKRRIAYELGLQPYDDMVRKIAEKIVALGDYSYHSKWRLRSTLIEEAKKTLGLVTTS